MKSIYKGQVAEGEYLEVWASPRRWRRELQLGDYHYIGVSDPNDEKVMWVLENKLGFTMAGDFVGLIRLDELRTDFKSNHQKVKRVFDQTKGSQLRCIESEEDANLKRTFCFDTSTNELRRAETSPRDLSPERTEYSGYRHFESSTFPAMIRRVSDGRSVDLTITKLQPEISADPSTFSRPTGAMSRGACPVATMRPKMLRHGSPKYPAGETGPSSVRFWFMLSTDGRPHDIKLLEAKNGAFAKSALKVVQEMLYQPAMCQGQPIEGQVTLEISVEPFSR